MKLLTKEIAQKLPPFHAMEGKEPGEIPIIVKFFCPWNQWTWYAYEGQPVEDDEGKPTEDYLFFGYVRGVCEEFGYFLLSELEEITAPGGLCLKIERDLYFQGTLQDVLEGKRQ